MEQGSMIHANDRPRNVESGPRERFYELKRYEREQRLPYLLRLVRENADEIIVTTNADGSSVTLSDLEQSQDWAEWGAAVSRIVELDEMPRGNCLVCHPAPCERKTCGRHHDDRFFCWSCHDDAGDAAADRDNDDE